jgi:hypothetical protein
MAVFPTSRLVLGKERVYLLYYVSRPRSDVVWKVVMSIDNNKVSLFG